MQEVRGAVMPRMLLVLLLSMGLVACGSSGNDDGSSSSAASSSSSSSSATSSVPATVTISGRVTYDYVPIISPGGLDYDATESRPVRWAEAQLLNASGTPLDTTRTDTEGNYTLTAPSAVDVRVRVVAQSVATGAQSWNIRVEDNTASNALYGMVGDLVSSGTHDSARDLHAPSGWGGNSYTSTRVAAPFAILDTVYESLQTLRAVDSSFSLETSYFRWSPLNRPADGNLADGDIGTSFYDTLQNALYILGDENNDTDEYDRHVIAHEWGHYLEDVLVGRMDSIGGPHSSLDKLDMRVAWSEGFANAFSGIALDDPLYLDSGGFRQSEAGGVNISNTRITNPGWFNEGSVQSLLYNFSASNGFDKIYNVFTHNNFGNSESLLSVFTFTERLEDIHPGVFDDWLSRLEKQNINSDDQFGIGESNNGGDTSHLPVYKFLPSDGTEVMVCNSEKNGKYNKLGVRQFFRFGVSASGNYRFVVEKTADSTHEADPDMNLYFRGSVIKNFWSFGSNIEQGSDFLESGKEYILEVFDYNHIEPLSPPAPASCFNVSLEPNF